MRTGKMEISIYNTIYCELCQAPLMIWELEGVLISDDVVVVNEMDVVGECPYCSYLFYLEDVT